MTDRTKNIKKIVLMNSQIEHSTHEIIDSCLAIATNAISPIVELAFLKGHNDCVRTLAEKYNKDIRFTTSDHHLPKFVTKLLYGPKKFCMALHEAYVFMKKGGRNNVTFLTYSNPFNMYLLNFISKITSWPLIFCVHAEAEIFSMSKEKNDGIRKRLGKRFYKHAKLGKHVSMMVLGDNVLSTLLQRMPESEHYKFTAWEHPYFETKERQSKTLSKEIKVGVIGFVRAEKARGFDNILEFAKQLESHPDISLALLGPIMQKEFLPLIPSNVDVKNPTGTLVERSVYEKWIEELDYIYCPYPDDAFQLTASGAILEAIISRRPIISHANAFTLYLRKKNGEFGLMIENENWQEVINQLHDPARYNRLIEDQNKLISNLAPENYVESLSKIIETVV